MPNPHRISAAQTHPPAPVPPPARRISPIPGQSNHFRHLSQIKQRHLFPLPQLHARNWPLSPANNFFGGEPVIQCMSARTTFLLPEIIRLPADLIVEIQMNEVLTMVAVFHDFS